MDDKTNDTYKTIDAWTKKNRNRGAALERETHIIKTTKIEDIWAQLFKESLA